MPVREAVFLLCENRGKLCDEKSFCITWRRAADLWSEPDEYGVNQSYNENGWTVYVAAVGDGNLRLATLCPDCSEAQKEQIVTSLMPYKDLKRCLDGFFAYDQGCIDSGIKDPEMRQRVNDYLMAMNHLSRYKLLMRIGQEMYGKSPYTLDDHNEWEAWTHDQGWC